MTCCPRTWRHSHNVCGFLGLLLVAPPSVLEKLKTLPGNVKTERDYIVFFMIMINYVIILLLL